MKWTEARLKKVLERFPDIKKATLDKWKYSRKQIPDRYLIRASSILIDKFSLYELRARTGLTQTELAAKLNSEYGTNLWFVNISDWESGKIMPNETHRAILVDFFEQFIDERSEVVQT